MSNTDPPSPAASQPRPDATSTDLSNGFQHLVSYNQSLQYQRQVQSQSPFEPQQPHHGLPQPYGSYTPVEEYPDTPAYYSSVYPELPQDVSSSLGPVSSTFPGDPHERADFGFALRPAYYPQAANMTRPFQSTPQSFSHSPPVVPSKRYPLRHTESDPLRGSQSVGVTKSKPKAKPRSRKKKADDAERTYKFARPLSEMCNEVTEINDADIEAWVTRSTAVRREERENTKHKRIKRPMNAFMLYRKAHQLRVKHLWSHENHQIVSAVCGDGWAAEPEHVIAQYNEWARVERDNHAAAFPNYKFAPAKPKKEKRPGGEGSDDEFEMPDMFGGLGGAGPGGLQHHPRSMSAMSGGDHGGADADYHHRPSRGAAASVYSPFQATQPLPPGRAVAQYSYQSTGKPLPMGYGGDLGHPEYYRQEVARYDPAPMPQQHQHQHQQHPHQQHHPRGLHHAMPPGYHDQATIENLYMMRPSPAPAMGAAHPQHIPYPSYSAHGTPAPPEPFTYPPPHHHAPAAAMPVHHQHLHLHHQHQQPSQPPPPPPSHEPALYLEPSLYGHEGDTDDFGGGGLGIFHDHFAVYGDPEATGHYVEPSSSHFVDAGGPFDPTPPLPPLPPPPGHDDGLLDAALLHILDPALQDHPPPHFSEVGEGGGEPEAGAGGDEHGHEHDHEAAGDTIKWDTTPVESQAVSHEKLDGLLDEGDATTLAALAEADGDEEEGGEVPAEHGADE